MFNRRSLYQLSASRFITGLAILAVLIWVSSSLPVARAAVTEATAPASMVVTGQTIKASSSNTPVIRFRLTGDNANNTVTQVAVTIADAAAAGGTITAGDLASLKVFKSADNAFGGDTEVGSQTTVAIGSATNIAVTDTLGANSSWYIVTVATSAGATSNRAFKATMAVNAITVGGDGAGTLGTALAAGAVQALTIDTTAPTVNNSATFPTNGITNAPISGFIHMTFSENMDESTLTPANITMTGGGNPVKQRGSLLDTAGLVEQVGAAFEGQGKILLVGFLPQILQVGGQGFRVQAGPFG